MAIRLDENMTGAEWKAQEERIDIEQERRDASIARFAHDHPDAIDVLAFLIDSDGK